VKSAIRQFANFVALTGALFGGCSHESKPPEKSTVEKLRSSNEAEQLEGAQEAKKTWGVKKEGEGQ
jgi:hypothetical protein